MARYHNFSAAVYAADLKIRADTQDVKQIAAAGVGFFHLQPVADTNIHGHASFSFLKYKV